MNWKDAVRKFNIFRSNRIITPEGNPKQGSYIFGTGNENAKELITKKEAFDHNLGYVYACSNMNAKVIAASRLRLFVMSTADSKAVRRPHKRLKGWEREEVVRKAADARIVGGIELDEIFDHPFLDLMRLPYETGTQQTLFSNTQTGQELQGDNLWVFSFNRRLGIPETVNSVPIDRVELELKKNGRIKSYIIDLGEKKIRTPIEATWHFKMPPSYDYFGTSPLTAASLSSKLFNNTLILETGLAKNQAIPATIVKYTGGDLSRDDKRQLEADWNSTLRGLSKSGKVKVIDDMYEVDQLSLSPRELQFLEGRKMLREDICAIYGTPVTLWTSEANLASAKTAIDVYNLFTIEPRLQTLQQTINARINELYPAAEGRLFVVLENQVTLKDEAARHAMVFQAHAQGLIEEDEGRHLLNLGE